MSNNTKCIFDVLAQDGRLLPALGRPLWRVTIDPGESVRWCPSFKEFFIWVVLLLISLFVFIVCRSKLFVDVTVTDFG